MILTDDEIKNFILQLNKENIYLSHKDGKIVIKSNEKVSEENINTIKCNKPSILSYLIHMEKYFFSSKYIIPFNTSQSNRYIFQLPGFMSMPTGLEYFMQSLADYQAFGFEFTPEMDFIEFVTETILATTNIDSTIVLTGICVGNLLAFEVCSALENRGRKVECLLILTSPELNQPRNHSLSKIHKLLDELNGYLPETKKFHEDNPTFREEKLIPFLLYINNMYFNKVLKTKIIHCYTSDFIKILDETNCKKITSGSHKIVLLEGNHISFYEKENMEINIPRILSALEEN